MDMSNNSIENNTSLTKDEMIKKFDFTFVDLMSNETRMSLILILMTYGSLNLRQLSSVLGISEPSTHAHITELLAQEAIILDSKMAGKRGKYYKIDPDLGKFLGFAEKEFEASKPEKVDLQYYQNMAIGLKTLALMTKRFGLYAASYLDKNAEGILERYKEKMKEGKEEESLISGSLSFINLKSKDEFDEINKAFKEFTETIQRINEKNEDLEEEELYETMMISSLLVPLLKLDPRED